MNEVVIPKITFWKIQSYESGEKAKKINSIRIISESEFLQLIGK